MRQLLGLLAFVLMVSSCKKNNTSDSLAGELSGHYMGTFNRSGMDTVQVSFYFNDDNTFKGTGEVLNYPAICSGNFLRSSNGLIVNNGCAWTANFDWTLIFEGNFNINFSGEKSVRIWRTNGIITDEYILNRPIR